MIQPTGSAGYGVTRIWRRTYSLGRSASLRKPLLVLAEGLERRVQLAHPARHPRRALLDDADLSRGKRSSTPSKIIVASVCIGGYGIAM